MNKTVSRLFTSLVVTTTFNAAGAFAQQATSEGTLRIAGKMIAFQIEVCQKMDVGGLDQFMLAGTERSADGKTTTVQVIITGNDRKIEHAVTVMSVDGNLSAAARKVGDEDWVDAHGNPAGPLISVDGKRITAKGTFYKPTYPAQSAGEGTLDAYCAQLVVTETQ